MATRQGPFTRTQAPTGAGQYGTGYMPYQVPGVATGPGVGPRVQQNINVQPQAQPTDPLKGLVNSLEAKMLMQQGAGWQARGAETRDVPSRYGPMGNKRSFRNTLLGSVQGHWGRSDMEEAAQMATDQEKAQRMAQAKATGQMVLAQTGNQQLADAAYEMALAGQDVDMGGLGSQGPKITDVNALQTQINNTGGKVFREKTGALRDIASYAQGGNPMSDHALIFKYMKFLDPTSTIRQSEFDTVEAVGAWDTRVQQFLNKALNGDGLTPDQRGWIVNTVMSSYPEVVASFDESMAPFRSRAARYHISEDDLSFPKPFQMPEDFEVSSAVLNAPPKPGPIPGLGGGETKEGSGVTVTKDDQGRNVWTRPGD